MKNNNTNKKSNKNNKKIQREPIKINKVWFDIIGILLILLSPTLYFIGYNYDNVEKIGFLGRIIGISLKYLFNAGSVLFPIVVLYSGIFILINNHQLFKEKKTFNFWTKKSFWGVCLLFISILGLISGNEIDPNLEPINNLRLGGYIGYFIYFIFSKLFGKLVYYFLSVLSIISVFLICNFSYSKLLELKNGKSQENKVKNNDEIIKSNKDNKPKENKIDIAVENKPSLLDQLLEENSSKNKEKKDNKNEHKNTNEGAFSFNKVKKNLDFKLPPSTLLNTPAPKVAKDMTENINNIQTIENTLNTFNIDAEVLNVSDGPTVSRYEIKLAEGIKVQKIVNLADNLAMSLAAIDVRIEAPIPGKSAIGVEVPKLIPTMVTLREIIEDSGFQKSKGILTFALGKDVAEKAIFADLTKMPHLLIGGATNSGKSVGLNTLIASLLYRMTPDELRFVMIDPKRVELSLYEGIPHLACPVIKDAKLAAGALKSVEQEMDRRYKILEESQSRNIVSYNEKSKIEDKLPYMVVVIDELADLMMQCPKDVEFSICRLAQLARAVGIHLVVATQRPSVDIITGKIKANIPSRIAFAVSSHHDSKTILDRTGAERLIGRGDMLFFPTYDNKPNRVQGCYLSEEEIDHLVSYLKEQQKPDYNFEPKPIGDNSEGSEDLIVDDDLWIDVVKFIVQTGYCSTSTIQRHFKIGYNRAGRLVDLMESKGIIGPLNGAKPRDVLISESDLDRILYGENDE